MSNAQVPIRVYLTEALASQLRTRAEADGVRFFDVVVDAAANHLSEMRPKFAAARKPTIVTGFPTRRQPTPSKEPVTIRLEPASLDWLDNEVLAATAPSRNALVTALLTAYLT